MSPFAASKSPPASRERATWPVMGLTGVLAIGFTFLAFRTVPTFEETYGRVAGAEARALGAWRAIVADAQAGRLDGFELADRIERDVLPPWKEARAAVADIEAGPWADRLPDEWTDALRLRQQAWEAMTEAARHGDADQSRRAQAAWAEADRAATDARREIRAVSQPRDPKVGPR